MFSYIASAIDGRFINTALFRNSIILLIENVHFVNTEHTSPGDISWVACFTRINPLTARTEYILFFSFFISTLHVNV